MKTPLMQVIRLCIFVSDVEWSIMAVAGGEPLILSEQDGFSS